MWRKATNKIGHDQTLDPSDKTFLIHACSQSAYLPEKISEFPLICITNFGKRTLRSISRRPVANFVSQKNINVSRMILLNKCCKYLVLLFINALRKWGENKRMITEPCDKNCRNVQRTYLFMCPLEMKEIGIIIYLQRRSNYAGFCAKRLSVIFSGQ